MGSARHQSLPPGLRSDLVYAIYADDPEAVGKHLKECSSVELRVLLSERGGKIPLMSDWKPIPPGMCYPPRPRTGPPFSPWQTGGFDYQNQPTSALRAMDDMLYGLIKLSIKPTASELNDRHNNYDHDLKGFKPANIYTLAFVIAARRNCTGKLRKMRVVTLLMSDMYRKKVDVGYDEDEVLCAAVRSDNIEFVKLLMKFGRDPFVVKYHLVGDAVGKGYVDIVKIFLSDKRVGPSIKDNQWGLFSLAMSDSGDDVETPQEIEMVKLLIHDGRDDPSKHNNNAVAGACGSNKPEIVKLLLKDKRVDPSEWDQRALRGALHTGNIEVIKALFTDKRVVVSAHIAGCIDVDRPKTPRLMVDSLFAAAGPRFWPGIISNNILHLLQEEERTSNMRGKLDELELQSSWLFLLCVKRMFSNTVAVIAGDVLREVCFKWTRLVGDYGND